MGREGPWRAFRLSLDAQEEPASLHLRPPTPTLHPPPPHFLYLLRNRLFPADLPPPSEPPPRPAGPRLERGPKTRESAN